MKKLIYCMCFTMLAVSGLRAQQTVVLNLWPNGAPSSNGLTGEEEIQSGNRISNVTNPTLTVFLPEHPDGRAVVMCPGGGYVRLCMDYEGYDMAPWFNAQGITYAVLKYRMPNGHGEVPLDDLQQAIRMIRNNAELWNLNSAKVGVMGASAGGHLASLAATHYDESCRPDFQVLLYPVISLLFDSNASEVCGTNLFGPDATNEQLESYSSNLQVTAETPPAFIALSTDDKSVEPLHSVSYYTALHEHKIPVSLHIYPFGGHGWGFLDSFIYKPNWTADLAKWLATGLDEGE